MRHVITGRPPDTAAGRRYEGVMHRTVGRIRLDGRLAEQVARPPVITTTAAERGPVVAITANIHGDECTGVLATHEIDAWLQQHLARGTVHIYPTLNPAGLAARTRGMGTEGADLNRLFPGDATSTAAERLAHAIWRDLHERQPAVLIDLHADSAASIPYAIIDRPIALRGRNRAEMEAQLVALAEATGLTVLRDYPIEQYQRFGLDRSLAGALVNRSRVPAVTIESGPRRVVDREAVAVTVEAVKGVLGHLGLAEVKTRAHPTRCADAPWRRSTSVRARAEGLFVPALPPGARFRAGQVLGEVRGLAGEILEEVRAPEDGLVVSWLDTCWVASGASIGTLGVPDGDEEGRVAAR